MNNPIDLDGVDNQYLKSWNWGAFFLMPVWGFGNGCWWALLLIPFSPIANIILAIYASRLAWRNKHWDNFYQFRIAQDTWAKGAVIGFLFSLALSILYVLLFCLAFRVF